MLHTIKIVCTITDNITKNRRHIFPAHVTRVSATKAYELSNSNSSIQKRKFNARGSRAALLDDVVDPFDFLDVRPPPNGHEPKQNVQHVADFPSAGTFAQILSEQNLDLGNRRMSAGIAPI